MKTKEEVFAMHDKISELKNKKNLIGLNDQEDLELRNLEVKFSIAWSEFKG